MFGKYVLIGACAAAAATASVSGASAQYYREGFERRGYERSYDAPRRGGDDRGYRGDRGYERGGYDRRDERRDDSRGFEQRAAQRPVGGRGDPMAGMSLDERKRAIKNHREAQKQAIKRGYVIP